jgi:hypothetical protein
MTRISVDAGELWEPCDSFGGDAVMLHHGKVKLLDVQYW